MKNGKCFDIGTIQAFLDGELSNDLSLKVTNHAADCDACAMAIAEADEESSLVFSALDRELNTLVPTQRLWGKINESITVERDNAPFLQKVWGFITLQLATPSFAAAAAVLVVFSIFSVVWTMRSGLPTVESPQVAVVTPVPVPADIANRSVGPAVAAETQPPVLEADTEIRSTTPRYTVVRANYRANSRPAVRTASNVAPRATTLAYMPGEETYVNTIATMSESVNKSKNDVMRPSEQIAFERDLAVLNDAISRMQKEVRKNPKNESAKQVLYTSYQNKIDLLNSVSQREELIASLK